MKVYADHAYVVSEANGHGLQVLDLNQLRELSEFPATLEPTTWLDTFSDAHNVIIDEGSGLLYAVGTNLAGGGIVAFDLSDPVSPVLVGDYSEAGYTHDAQGVVYNGPDSDFAGKSIICLKKYKSQVAPQAKLPSQEGSYTDPLVVMDSPNFLWGRRKIVL